MPAEPIDEYSIKLNADVESLITTTQDAMDQVEEMMDDLAKKGKELGKIEPEKLAAAFERITEVFGETRESAAAAEEAVRKLEAAGVDGAAAYVVFADALDGIVVKTEDLGESLSVPGEGFELQAEKLDKINEGLQIMSKAWTDAGKAIPIERLDALENKLNKIFKEGIFTQRLSPDEVFKRMEEAVEESIKPLERLKDKLDELDPKQVEFIAEEMMRAEQAFIDAGKAIPFEQLDRLENKLVKIAKLSGVDKEGIAAGYQRGVEVTDKLISNVTELTAKQKVLNEAFTEFELGQAAERKAEQLEALARAAEDAGQAVPVEKMRALGRQIDNIVLAAAEMGVTMPDALIRTDEATIKSISSLVQFKKEVMQTQGVMGNLASKVGGAFGINVQKMIGQTKQLLRGATAVAGKFGVAIGAISTAAIAAAGVLVVLGLAILALTKLAKEGMQIALRNADVHHRFTLVIREQQRALGDLAFSQREAHEAAAQLTENFGLAREEAESLLSTTIFLTREFKLTADEVLNLADASVVLAKQAGIAPESALRSLTQFMLTGYTRGLQRLGIQIKDGEVELRAYNKGLIEFGEEVNEATRAAVALEIVMEKAEEGRQDAIDSTSEWANRIKIARQEANKAKEDFGNMFLGVSAKFEEIKTNVLEKVLDLIKKLTFNAMAGILIIEAFGKTVAETMSDNRLNPRGTGGGQVAQAVGEDESFGERLQKNLDEAGEKLQGYVDKVKNLGDDTEKGTQSAAEAFEEFELKVSNASLKIKAELEKLQEKFDEAMARIQQRLADTLEKIRTDFGRRRTDAATDLNRDMRDIDKSAQEDVVDATMDHNEELFRIEEDHKLKMQRLEDQFLFDLEDAVRERDARGVLMAIRRFNQQKKEMQQDKNIRTKRLKEDFKNELKEIERERMKRRAERLLEFGEESDDLALQEARRREDAFAAQARAERQLAEANERKLEIMAKGFLAEFLQTNFSLNAIFKLMQDYLGEGGFVDRLYDYISGQAANLNLVPDVSLSDQTSTIADSPLPLGLRARGGTLLATSPTLALFGEGGPERVDFTPLSAGTGLPKAGFDGAGGGSTDINLEVMLEDGLEARLVDQTMDGVANVLINIGRKASR